MDDPGSSALVLNIIQLTVLIVGLLAAAKLVTSSNKMTSRIANATEGLAKRFGADKGLDKMRGKMGSSVKGRAQFAGAHMAGSLEKGRFGNKANKAYTGVRDFRRKRAIGSAARESAVKGRAAAHDAAVREGVTELVGSGTGTNPSRLAKAVVVAGGDKFAGYAAQEQQEAFKKEVEGIRASFELKGLGPDDVKKALEDAIAVNDRASATAAINRLSQFGATGVEKINDVVTTTSITDVGTQRAVASAIHSSDAVTKHSPEIQKGSGYGTPGEADASDTFQTDFNGLSTEQVANLSPKALERYAKRLKDDKASATSPAEVQTANDNIARAKAQLQTAAQHQQHSAALLGNVDKFEHIRDIEKL